MDKFNLKVQLEVSISAFSLEDAEDVVRDYFLDLNCADTVVTNLVINSAK